MTRFEHLLATFPRIVLVGRSAVGKTTLADIARPGRTVLNTGWQDEDGDTPRDIAAPAEQWKERPYHWIGRLATEPAPWLLEGTEGGRVVRAWLRDLSGEPDAVVHVVGSHAAEDLPAVDVERGGDISSRAKRAIGRAKGHATIWDNYLQLREAGAQAAVFEGTLEDWLADGELDALSVAAGHDAPPAPQDGQGATGDRAVILDLYRRAKGRDGLQRAAAVAIVAVARRDRAAAARLTAAQRVAFLEADDGRAGELSLAASVRALARA